LDSLKTTTITRITIITIITFLGGNWTWILQRSGSQVC
jgi:hypothetical protein